MVEKSELFVNNIIAMIIYIKKYMEKHFPFKPEQAVLLNSKSLSTRKNIFCLTEPLELLFYHLKDI